MKIKRYLLITLASFCVCQCFYAQTLKKEDLMNMSLEELMNMEITSVSKKVERLQDVASSIYVLTADDIMKSGATTVHEALRTVPGYWGAQDEYSTVQPNIRVSRSVNAFDGSVLYLLDGTPIQDLITSNFTFRNFDIPLSEIDRIEIIRGSGGTIYGANSATGVVNIFTKKPGDYSGFRTSIEGGTPGYVAASIRASDVLSDKISISGYVKHRYFSGFDSMAGVDENGNETVASTRFKKDYNKSNMLSFGFKLDFYLSEETKLAFRSHYNTLSKYDYSNYVTDESFDILTSSITSDKLVEKNIHADRLVANIRLDHKFNDDHSLFFRVSSNRENDYNKINGGYELFNSIYDFEAQDNLSIGSSFDLSFGVNYRLVHFNIHDIEYKKGINFVDPKARESLAGAFVQSKMGLLDDKLNITLGIKAENYSLINDKYYLSPMAKFAYIPVKSFTLWGGFTQSYTTPGFNQTNIDLYFFETPPLSAWTTVATQAVYGNTYQQAYQQAINNGETPQDAATIASKSGK
jgi:outer membrane cobalamin receptor